MSDNVGPYAALCTGIVSGTVALVTLLKRDSSKGDMNTTHQIPSSESITHMVATMDKLIESHTKLYIEFTELSKDQEYQKLQIDEIKKTLSVYHTDLKTVRDIYQKTLAAWYHDDKGKG